MRVLFVYAARVMGHVGGTCGSDTVSSAPDVIGMRGVGGVCGMCLARGGVERQEREWMRRLGLPILWEQGECWTFDCVGGEWAWNR